MSYSAYLLLDMSQGTYYCRRFDVCWPMANHNFMALPQEQVFTLSDDRTFAIRSR